MKRILTIMNAVTFLVFFVLSAFDYIVQSSASLFCDKTIIEFNSEYDFSLDGLISRIEEACKLTDTDVAFVLYDNFIDTKDDKSKVVIFTTCINTNFLPFSEKIDFDNNKAYSTKKSDIEGIHKLDYPDIAFDYYVYPISEINKSQYIKASCIINSDEIESFEEKMSEQFVNVSAVRPFSYKDDTFYILLLVSSAFLLLLLFTSMIYYQLANSKNIAVKILDGYKISDFISDEIKSYLSVCGIEFCIFFSIASLYLTLSFGFGTLKLYLSKYYLLIIFLVLIILIMFSVSCIFSLFVAPLKVLKGSTNRRIIRVLTFGLKIVIICVMMVTIKTNIEEYKENCTISEKYNYFETNLKNYYNLSFYTDDYENEVQTLDFYNCVKKKFDVILMEAMSTNAAECYRDIQYWKIKINDNYLDINPVYDIDNKLIEVKDFPEGKETILVAESDQSRENEILSTYAKELNTDINNINIIYYNDDQKFYKISFCSYDDYIQYPIVCFSEDPVLLFSAMMNGDMIFKSHTDNFYSEIEPFLSEYNVLGSIGGISNIVSDADEYVTESKLTIFVVVLANIFLLSVIIITLVYENWIYFEDNKKLIVIKKLDGFSFADIHRYKIVLKLAVLVFLTVYSLVLNINILLPISICMIDYTMFYMILESKATKYSAEVMKGE